MNEKEKKAIEELSKKAVLCNYEEKDYPNMICFKKDMIIALNLIEKLQKENEELKSENRRLKVIRYSTEYGTENIHLITKRDLVEINTNKYFIEIQDRKFVDLKQVYLENKKLNEYKENYIPIQKVKDKIEELNNISNAEKLEDIMIGGNYTITELVQYVLQELIEGRSHE